jgi:hypothetical protein
MRARLAGDGELFQGAAGRFREIGLPFWLAVTLLEHGELLIEQGSPGEAEPVFAEAGEIFERLEARPWLERAATVGRTQVTA